MKEPFMDDDAHPVMEWDYKEETKDITLYQYCQIEDDDFEYCLFCEEEGCRGQCKQAAWNVGYKRQPSTPNIDLSEMTLQGLLDLLPQGVEAKDVRILIGADDWSGVPYTKISFVYKKHFPADMEQFKIDKAIYDQKYAAYEIKRAEYEVWKKEQEIAKKEEELNKLKLQLKR